MARMIKRKTKTCAIVKMIRATGKGSSYSWPPNGNAKMLPRTLYYVKSYRYQRFADGHFSERSLMSAENR